MYIPFNELPDTARVWIYQANRVLSASEEATINSFLQEAVAAWAAHGSGLRASFQILHHRFVVVAADEQLTQASGCSIDASSRWFKHLGQELGLDFFDRTQLLQQPDGTWGSYLPLQAKQALAEGILTAESNVFTHQVGSLGQLRRQWPVPAHELPALKRFFVSA